MKRKSVYVFGIMTTAGILATIACLYNLCRGGPEMDSDVVLAEARSFSGKLVYTTREQNTIRGLVYTLNQGVRPWIIISDKVSKNGVISLLHKNGQWTNVIIEGDGSQYELMSAKGNISYELSKTARRNSPLVYILGEMEKCEMDELTTTNP